MPFRVSVLFCVHVPSATEPKGSTQALTSVARLFAARKWEATFVIDHADSASLLREENEVARLLRSQNVALGVGQGPTSPLSRTKDADFADAVGICREAYHADFVNVSRFAASLPTAVVMRGWSPCIVPLVSNWGPHVILTPSTFVDDDGIPFHWGTRLHLAQSNSEWIDLSQMDAHNLAETILTRVQACSSQGGIRPVLVNIPLTSWGSASSSEDALAGLNRALDQLASNPLALVQSARQLADRYDDISYEHSVPADFFRSIAPSIVEGKLGPLEYALGYVTPAEQLYGFARLWLSTLEKGRAARNTLLRGSIGPEAFVQTDSRVEGIVGNELKDVLTLVTRSLEDTGKVPASVPTHHGALSAADLLATLAAGYLGEVAERDLPIHKAVLPTDRIRSGMVAQTLSDAQLSNNADVSRAVDAARCQLWTFKPAKLID